jgi:dephospho-CoA kinase
MTGSGKSEASRFFKSRGFPVIHFGAITLEELAKQNLAVNPANERAVRESIRSNEGMDAYARRSLAKIKDALLVNQTVVIDGLYSTSEFLVLKKEFGSALEIIAIFTSRQTRYLRLAHRKVRPLSSEEASERDLAEVLNLEKGGPIALADRTIINDDDIKSFENALLNILD